MENTKNWSAFLWSPHLSEALYVWCKGQVSWDGLKFWQGSMRPWTLFVFLNYNFLLRNCVQLMINPLFQELLFISECMQRVSHTSFCYPCSLCTQSIYSSHVYSSCMHYMVVLWVCSQAHVSNWTAHIYQYIYIYLFVRYRTQKWVRLYLHVFMLSSYKIKVIV